MREAGYTLVESIIALAITGVIATTSGMVFFQVVRSLDYVENRALAVDVAITCLSTVESQLRSAIKGQSTSFSVKVLDEGDSLQFYHSGPTPIPFGFRFCEEGLRGTFGGGPARVIGSSAGDLVDEISGQFTLTNGVTSGFSKDGWVRIKVSVTTGKETADPQTVTFVRTIQSRNY